MPDRSAVEPDAEAEVAGQYTVLIRFPFPRGDSFVDPPLVEWDASKDRELWKSLSQSPRDIDWKKLADRFDVNLPFILQQAAWLYERQLSQVRDQMRRVSKVTSSTAVHTEPSAPVASLQEEQAETSGRPSLDSGQATPREPTRSAFSRAGSLEGHAERIPSRLAQQLRRDARTLSRTPSSNTVTQSRLESAASPIIDGKGEAWTQLAPTDNPAARNPASGPPESVPEDDASSAQDSSSSSSSSSSDEESAPTNPRHAFRRPRFGTVKTAERLKASVATSQDDNQDDEEDDTPAFLPLVQRTQGHKQDMGATVRSPVQARATSLVESNASAANTPQRGGTDSSATSSASSAAVVSPNVGRVGGRGQRLPLSPQQRAELAKLSPRRQGTRRDGSDGTPSMGSSFSDLDDAGVTQSALEEALLSNMQHGAMTSRMSSISQALKSRYL